MGAAHETQFQCANEGTDSVHLVRGTAASEFRHKFDQQGLHTEQTEGGNAGRQEDSSTQILQSTPKVEMVSRSGEK